jgi:hypothetical protein
VAILAASFVWNLPFHWPPAAHSDRLYGPIMAPWIGKTVCLVFCVPVLIRIWTGDIRKIEDNAPDLDSGDIQTLFSKPKDDTD